MRFVAIALSVLALASAAGALNRADVPSNEEAYFPPSNPHHGPQNGDGMFILGYGDATVYYNQAAFVAVLEAGYYFDDFSWVHWATITGPSYTFGPVNGFAYTASAPSELYSIEGAVSTNTAGDILTLTLTDGLPVTAVGGDFFGTDFNGNPISATTTVALNDGTTVQLVHPTTFVGFTSAVPIVSLTIVCDAGGALVWSTYDNFYVGREMTSPVEHESWGRIKALFQ